MATPHGTRTPALILFTVPAALMLAGTAPAQGGNQDDRIKNLESAFEAYKRDAERERMELKKQIQELREQRSETSQQQLDDAIAELRANVDAITNKKTTIQPGNQANYMNMSFNTLVVMGGSQATDEEMPTVQPGAHDPLQRGFTIQQGELQVDALIDPYFKSTAVIITGLDQQGETYLELEEAYLQTIQMPADLQLKAGQYFTEFGRLNRQHPHEWDFVDQPLVNSRMFGGDGLRAPGARMSWLAPTPFFLELQTGVQNARGETVTSFLANDEVYDPVTGSSGNEIAGSIGGRPYVKNNVNSIADAVLTQKISASTDVTPSTSIMLGGSALFGPNATGQSGRTQIYGTDFTYKWKPLNHQNGFPFIKFQGEVMWRNAFADSVNADLDGDGTNEVFASRTFRDWGTYGQLLWGFARPWVAGIRFDYVDGDGASTGGSGLLDRRYRVSPNITFFPSEFSRIRLQANFDRIQELGDRRFTGLWLQFEVIAGNHAPHRF